MLFRRTITGISAVAAMLAWPSIAGAQTTIDLEEIRRQHAEGGDGDESADQDDSADGGDSAITIESSGGTNTTSFSGRITLEFDKRGSSMLVPAEVAGKSVYFLFDTGATFTTLTPSFARSIGASPPKNAPSTVSRTANGRRRFEFGIVPSITLDGRVHRNITYGACSACGGITYRGKPVVGLLGLNLLRRYRIDVDHSAGEIQLEPGPHYSDRTHDIAPWIDVRQKRPEELELGDFHTAFEVENRAPRAVEVDLSIRCKFRGGQTETITTGSTAIQAGDTEILTARSGKKFCHATKVDVESASW
jgi:hypothetical protein